MRNTIRTFIQQVIEDNMIYQNLLIRADKIQLLTSDTNFSNFDIYEEMQALENMGIIKIKTIARQGQTYSDRSRWIELCDQFTRYNIDVLKPEYFATSKIENSGWAIKASIDTKKRNFIIELNGIDEKIMINFKSAKGGRATEIMKFWKNAQNNANEWCKCGGDNFFAKPYGSINSFFERFCKDLKPFLIEFKKGGYEARFTPVVYPDVLKAKAIKDFVFFTGSDNRFHYECKFDNNGKFLGWHKC